MQTGSRGRAMPVDALDLFTAVDQRERIAACALELRALAERRGESGVTADDVFKIAERKGYATGHEANKRALSWFSQVPKAAKLYNSGRRRSGRSRNDHVIYTFLP